MSDLTVRELLEAAERNDVIRFGPDDWDELKLAEVIVRVWVGKALSGHAEYRVIHAWQPDPTIEAADR